MHQTLPQQPLTQRRAPRQHGAGWQMPQLPVTQKQQQPQRLPRRGAALPHTDPVR